MMVSIHIDWRCVPPWRQRLGAWCQWHGTVTIARLLGARVVVEADDA